MNLLLESDANPNIQDETGSTALIYGIDFSITSIHSLYNFYKAVRRNDLTIASVLLNGNASTDIKDDHNLTALIYGRTFF